MKWIPNIAFAASLCLLAGNLKATERTCRIVYPERPENAPLVAFLFDGKSSQQVTLPSMNLSEVIELPAGNLVITFTANEITDAKQLPTDALRLNIPEKISDFYIIISPDPKKTDFPIKLNLVNASDGKIRPGETLWYNFTNDRIAAQLGETKLTIDPRTHAISKSPALASCYYTAQFAFQVDGNGPYAPITEQYWWHDANSRHLGFITNSGGKLPKIFYYRDFRMPEAEIRAARDAGE